MKLFYFPENVNGIVGYANGALPDPSLDPVKVCRNVVPAGEPFIIVDAEIINPAELDWSNPSGYGENAAPTWREPEGDAA